MPTLIRLSKNIVLLSMAGFLAGCDRGSNDGAAGIGAPVEPFEAAVLAVLPPNASPEQLERGRELYATCSVCHGVDGRGTQLGPPLRGGGWIHISGEVQEIEQVIRSGIAEPTRYPIPMPVLGGGRFDDKEIKAIATYVYALSRGSS